MPLQLTVTTTDHDAYVHLVANGDITLKDFPADTSNPLDVALGADWPAKKLLIDFSHVSYIDSSAIGWLIGCQKQCRKAGGQLALHSVPHSVRQVLDLLRIGKVVPIADDEKAGLTLLTGVPA